MTVQEIKGEFTDIMFVTELRGSYPNVPISADVDYQALIKGDPDPMFLTIPIGKAGVTSGNQRHYDEAFVQELERQTLANKPIGLMGHLSQADRGTAFPEEAAHWVGAIREGNTLWGKAYIVPGPVRERIARYKAHGKAIATSIDAFAEGVWDETIKAFRMAAKGLRLNQIDLAPADRAGISDLARVPMLTSEIATTETVEIVDTPQEIIVDKLQVINELTEADARLLPEPVRQAILASVPTPAEVALVQELRTALDLPATADIKAHLVQMRVQELATAKATITARVRELVEDTERGVKIVALRGMITEMINLRKPQNMDEVEAIYAEVVGSRAVTEALAGRVQEVMGPRQGTPVEGQANAPKYFKVPVEA